MFLKPGDFILITYRRMFQGDEPRYFLGQTVVCENELLKIEGYTFVIDLSTGMVVKKGEKRVKLLSLASPAFIADQLPEGLNLDELTIVGKEGDLLLTSGTRILMNLSERATGG